jgi:hypothetical protein
MEIPKVVKEWEFIPYSESYTEEDYPPYFLWMERGVVRLSSTSDTYETIDFMRKKDIDEMIFRLMRAKVDLPE